MVFTIILAAAVSLKVILLSYALEYWLMTIDIRELAPKWPEEVVRLLLAVIRSFLLLECRRLIRVSAFSFRVNPPFWVLLDLPDIHICRNFQRIRSFRTLHLGIVSTNLKSTEKGRLLSFHQVTWTFRRSSVSCCTCNSPVARDTGRRSGRKGICPSCPSYKGYAPPPAKWHSTRSSFVVCCCCTSSDRYDRDYCNICCRNGRIWGYICDLGTRLDGTVHTCSCSTDRCGSWT